MMKEAKLAVLRHLKELMHSHEADSIRSKKHAMEEAMEPEHKEEAMIPHMAEKELSEEHPHLEESEPLSVEREEHDEEGIPLDKEARKKHFLKRMGR